MVVYTTSPTSEKSLESMDIDNLCQKVDNLAMSSFSNSLIPLRYVRSDMKLSQERIANLKHIRSKKLMEKRKLYLVLDLDQTLVHAVSLKDLKPDETYIIKTAQSAQNDLCYVDSFNMIVKFRPFVKKFLKDASDMFDLYIYTLGTRDYANCIADLLDPEGTYFGSRIISREDCTRELIKSLNVVLGKESATVIVDDTKEVWPDHQENLISVQKYFYFAMGQRCYKSLAQMKFFGKNECDAELLYVLGELKKIHAKFFEGDDQEKILEADVREVIDAIKNFHT